MVNACTNKQEIEEDKISKDNIDDDEVNLYCNIIINDIDRENVITSQMEQWLILSNVVCDVQYDRNPKNFNDLDVKAIDQKNHRKMYDLLKDEDSQILQLDFEEDPDKLWQYLDMYEGVQSEVFSTSRFDENSDLSATYLGGIDMTRASTIKAEE